MSPLSSELCCRHRSLTRTPLRPARWYLKKLILLLIYFPMTSCRSTTICWCFFLGKCVRTAAKTMVVGRKKQKALALLYLASGPLPNAAISSVVPTEFAAELTTKMKSSKANFATWTIRLPPNRQLSILLNFLFPFIDIWYFSQVLIFTSVELNRFVKQAKLFKKTSFSKATVVMRFPANKNAGCPKAPRVFPPRKDDILHLQSGCLGTPLPLPQSLYCGARLRWRHNQNFSHR